MIRVAVDAMGGDKAPQAEVAGALQALATLPEAFLVQLVGRRDVIEAELARHPDVDQSRLEIHEAADVIGMGEKPLAAVRKKPNSSVVVGLTLQKQGRSDAFLSSGNTGATLAASTVILGLHDGVERATVATLFPTGREPVIVLDGGANLDCSARELVGFAHLGTVYVRDILGRPKPVVGLLNIGEEEEKGTAIVREAHQLLRQSPGLSYAGNIEGRDILPTSERRVPVDVVVCDGFVGNVVLKFYESAGRFFVELLRERAPDLLEGPALRDLVSLLDYSTYGGAPLLGVRGVSIICHGSSSPNAIKNGIRVALQAVTAGLNAHIAAEFAQREPVARS
ncbi:MAG TPA: phosphate acyltransferase PlsX [Gemmatimonadales bacterium]|nr:phosphate acyltransferase PlsX [Gemmatimonadales bacterium]